jgi:hypothetical protein
MFVRAEARIAVADVGAYRSPVVGRAMLRRSQPNGARAGGRPDRSTARWSFDFAQNTLTGGQRKTARAAWSLLRLASNARGANQDCRRWR